MASATDALQMRILVTPDKFKGSLKAREVAESIAAGLRDVLPNAIIEIQPIADGGEGTADLIRAARGGEWIACAAHDALGRAIEARYVWLRENATAVLEMSEAAGAWRIAAHERDPIRANTFGVGELLRDAIRRGAREIIIGLGGSATNDGGFGMARALGFRFFQHDHELESPRELVKLTGIVAPPSSVAAAMLAANRATPEEPTWLPLQVKVIAAADVLNPLLGERGATRTFGPQKGATPDQLTLLEQALARLADIVARDLGCDFREARGAGAAGGLGFGLMSFCGATVRPGFDLIAEMVDLEAAMRRADVVITGEGSLDEQTLEGKAPAGVARLARKFGKRVFAIVGRGSAEQRARDLFDRLYELMEPRNDGAGKQRARAGTLEAKSKRTGA